MSNKQYNDKLKKLSQMDNARSQLNVKKLGESMDKELFQILESARNKFFHNKLLQILDFEHLEGKDDILKNNEENTKLGIRLIS